MARIWEADISEDSNAIIHVKGQTEVAANADLVHVGVTDPFSLFQVSPDRHPL